MEKTGEQEMLREFNNMYELGPNSGTTAPSQYVVEDENAQIAIESVGMPGGEFLYNMVIKYRHQGITPQNPSVIASLERSVREHADVWAELSKY